MTQDKAEMDNFTWQVSRNTLWKVSRDLEEMGDPLLRDIISPLLSALASTLDNAPEFIDSNASNWQKLEDAIWHDIWVSTKAEHPSRQQD